MRQTVSKTLTVVALLSTFIGIANAAPLPPNSAVVTSKEQKIAGCFLGICNTLIPNMPSGNRTTPTASPQHTNLNKIDSNGTTNTQDDGDVTWELESCTRPQKKVSCIFSLTSDKDIHYGIDIKGTRIVDSQGIDYYASFIQFGGHKITADDHSFASYVSNEMTQGAHYKTIIEFTNVPASVSQIVLLQYDPSHGGYYGSVTHGVKFRDIPIH